MKGAQIREECPQGLKPDFLGFQMSELKLRPPENHLWDGKDEGRAHPFIPQNRRDGAEEPKPQRVGHPSSYALVAPPRLDFTRLYGVLLRICFTDWPEGQSNGYGEYRTCRGSKRTTQGGLLQSTQRPPPGKATV